MYNLVRFYINKYCMRNSVFFNAVDPGYNGKYFHIITMMSLCFINDVCGLKNRSRVRLHFCKT